MQTLEHKTLKAATTATDKGEFTALAATYSVDRVNERIVPGAFSKTIAAWKGTGRQIPLHWDHSGSAEDIIGSVNPASMAETKDGLYVEGRVDLKDSEVAKEAWRSMKNNAVALSFGYLAKTKKEGKVTLLTEIDLFEVSIVPAPANNDTRLLSLKSVKPDFKSVEEVQAFLDERFPGHQISETSQAEKSDLRKRSLDLALEVANGFKEPEQVEPEPASEPEPIDLAELRRRSERATVDAALL